MTAETQSVSGVPGRYATALFELARDEKAVDKTGADLEALGRMLAGSPELTRLVRSPVFKAEDQIAALEALLAKAGIGGLALNFVRLAAKNRRLSALPGMIAGYRALMAEAKGEVQAEVTSAEKLTAKHVTALTAALKTTIGRDVQLAEKVDRSILGGLVVKVGSRMVDNSLKTKLQNLKIAMKGTA